MTVSEHLEGLAEPRRTHVRRMHCVRFKKPEDLDLDVVRELLRETARHFRVSGALQPPG